MRRLSCLLLGLTLGVGAARGQGLERPYEVGSLRFIGNDALIDDVLLNVIRTRETPWGIWKFIYRHISEKLGRQPEIYDPVAFEGDLRTLRRFYKDHGFFYSRIDTSIRVNEAAHEVHLAFLIDEGKRSFVDTVRIHGLANLPGDVVQELQTGRGIDVGDPFVLTQAETELRRMIGVFANNGYVRARVDTVYADRYASTNNVTLVYAFTPGIRYQFGSIDVEEDSGGAYRVDPAVVLRQLDFAEGDYYSEQKKVESERNLNRLGVFEVTKIENAPATKEPDSTHVSINVMVRTRPFHELTPEIGVNDENNAFNILTGFGYTHRNFFGGARSFSTRVRFSLQSIQDVNFARVFSANGLRDSSIVAKLDVSTQLIQPYFFNNRTTLSATFSGILDKQNAYFLPILRSRLGISSQTATHTRAFLDWSLELMDPRTVTTQEDTTFGTNGEFQKQFNSILTFTIQRDKRNDIFYPSSGFFHSAAIEEAGFFPRAFGGFLGIHLPYSQYVKFSALGQWYWDPTEKKDWIWALRLRAGAAFLYGSSPLDVPLTQRFYGGGSGSVRGWTARKLGAFAPPDYGGKALLEGTLEGRWNLLKGAGTLWFLDLEKISIVFFADAGNVWLDPRLIRGSELALAAGFGLRYNTLAGPIRVDFGMKMYDPRGDPGRRWVTQRRFFAETFSQGVIHLGVGHAF